MAVKRRAPLRAAAAVVCAAALAVSPTARMFCGRVLGQAALLASALAMPDGAWAVLRDRYAVLPESAAAQPPASASSLPESVSAAPESAPPDASPAASEPAVFVPAVPEQYRGVITARAMTGEDLPVFCPLSYGWIRNDTALSAAQVAEIVAQPPALGYGALAGPQVLVYHTHATESYEAYDSEWYDTRNTWRSADDAVNVVAVGAALASALAAHGVGVVQDTAQHDNPTYGGAYERSAETIRARQQAYPSLTVLLDVHRDAINPSENEICKVVAEIDGRKAAQLMIIAPCDLDGSLGIPDWRENLRFAAGFTAAEEARYPGLMRPVFFCDRTYNYSLSAGALLLEFGSSGNTLSEALYTAELVGPILAEYLASLA